MDKQGYVYMLASARYGPLYPGVTSDLVRRVWQHREVVDGFTKKHGVNVKLAQREKENGA
jgi:putative endonuclease